MHLDRQDVDSVDERGLSRRDIEVLYFPGFVLGRGHSIVGSAGREVTAGDRPAVQVSDEAVVVVDAQNQLIDLGRIRDEFGAEKDAHIVISHIRENGRVVAVAIADARGTHIPPAVVEVGLSPRGRRGRRSLPVAPEAADPQEDRILRGLEIREEGLHALIQSGVPRFVDPLGIQLLVDVPLDAERIHAVDAGLGRSVRDTVEQVPRLDDTRVRGILITVGRVVDEAREIVLGRIRSTHERSRGRDGVTVREEKTEAEDGIADVDPAVVIRIDRILASGRSSVPEETDQSRECIADVDDAISVRVAAKVSRILSRDLWRDREQKPGGDDSREREFMTAATENTHTHSTPPQ